MACLPLVVDEIEPTSKQPCCQQQQAGYKVCPVGDSGLQAEGGVGVGGGFGIKAIDATVDTTISTTISIAVDAAVGAGLMWSYCECSQRK